MITININVFNGLDKITTLGEWKGFDASKTPPLYNPPYNKKTYTNTKAFTKKTSTIGRGVSI